jgi:hypothetical protein
MEEIPATPRHNSLKAQKINIILDRTFGDAQGAATETKRFDASGRR